jgi:hypothetical protein
VTTPDQLAECVGRAQSHMHSALKNWDACSLPRCEECCELLRRAIGELESAGQAAEKGVPASRRFAAGWRSASVLAATRFRAIPMRYSPSGAPEKPDVQSDGIHGHRG